MENEYMCSKRELREQSFENLIFEKLVFTIIVSVGVLNWQDKKR